MLSGGWRTKCWLIESAILDPPKETPTMSALKRVTVFIGLIAVALLLHPTSAVAAEPIAGAEHWIQSVSGADGKPLKLYVWEKRLKATDSSAFAKSGKVVLL